MKLHPRFLLVNRADSKIRSHIADVSTEFDLTISELCMILLEIIQGQMKTAIRIERHGTTDKRGNEA